MGGRVTQSKLPIVLLHPCSPLGCLHPSYRCPSPRWVAPHQGELPGCSFQDQAETPQHKDKDYDSKLITLLDLVGHKSHLSLILLTLSLMSLFS